MAKRTQIVCIHEGKKNSVDLVFVNAFLKAYNPGWLRPYTIPPTTRIADFKPCGSKSELVQKFPQELKNCIRRGSDTTLIVLADIDDELENGEELKRKYWETAQNAGITQEMFEKAVFIFPKDRIENWIQYLSTGVTDENTEGPHVKDNREARDMAQHLANKCLHPQQTRETFPPSLEWSCRNWKKLVERMR